MGKHRDLVERKSLDDLRESRGHALPQGGIRAHFVDETTMRTGGRSIKVDVILDGIEYPRIPLQMRLKLNMESDCCATSLT
jgi:hypothetical protein